jgi:hypothetical protein
MGDEATKELYEDIDARDREVAATKVDRVEYDAHAALIAERFGRMEDKFDAHTRYVEQQFEIYALRFDKKISDAKRETIVWTVGLLTAVMGVWTGVIVGLLR